MAERDSGSFYFGFKLATVRWVGLDGPLTGGAACAAISAYETKIAKLGKQNLIAADKLKNKGKPMHTLEEMFELARAFLSNPWNF